MFEDNGEDEDERRGTAEVPLPGIPSEAVLEGVAGYMTRVAAAGDEPTPCREAVEGALSDYRLDAIVGAEWGGGFFSECAGGDCAGAIALLQAAEYMQMEGLRWLCAARLACAVRSADTEVELCGLFGVPLERMDRYAVEAADACAAMPWLVTENAA